MRLNAFPNSNASKRVLRTHRNAFRVACKRVRSLIAFGCACEMRLDAFLSSIALGCVFGLRLDASSKIQTMKNAFDAFQKLKALKFKTHLSIMYHHRRVPTRS